MIEKMHRNALIGLGALSLFIIIVVATVLGVATFVGILLLDLIF